MNPRQIIEAILFVAEEPIAVTELAELLESPTQDVEAELATLREELESGERGIVLRAVAGGWRLYSHPDAREYLERFAATERATRLSAAALETLAVVAYRQPVSRGQIGEIRGVDPERALHTLERRGLIVEVARASGPGQAVLYGTTDLFAEKMGLATLDELPPLADHVPGAEMVDVLERPFRPEIASSSGSTS